MNMAKRKAITIYMTEEEHTALKEAAIKLGVSMSTLVRMLVTRPDIATLFIREPVEVETKKRKE